MDSRHLCLSALVASPWLAISGAVLAGCGLLFCGEPERVVSGCAALVAGTGSGKLAWEVLWAATTLPPLATTT